MTFPPEPYPLVAVLGGGDCERVGAGWLAQPANAVSSLAFVVVGASLLRRAASSRTDRALLAAAGTAMAGVGLGSVAYHGPQPAWAELAHDGSIVGLALVLIGHGACRLMPRRRPGPAPAGVMAAGSWWPTAGWVAAALVAYALGRTGSPLCRPESLWQGHAAWHVLSALGFGAAFVRLAGAGRSGYAAR